MKNLITACKWAIAATLLVFACACNHDSLADTDAFTVTLSLTGDTTQQRTVPCAAGRYTVTFTTNKYWSATLLHNGESLDGSTLTPGSGAPSETAVLNFFLPANRDYSPRIFNLTLTANQVTLPIVITQLPFDMETRLTVTPAEATFESEGGVQEFTVTANVDWSLSGIPAWCTVTPATGKADQTVTVTATAALNTGAARESQLTFTAGNVTQNATLSQKRAIAQGTVTTVDTLFFGAEAASRGITLSATAAWTAQSGAAWCTVTPAAGDAAESRDIALTVGAYNGSTARETEVLFYIGQDVKHRTVVLQSPPLEGSTWDVFVKDTLTAEYFVNMLSSSEPEQSNDELIWDDTLSLSFANGKAYIDEQEAQYTQNGNRISILQKLTASQQYLDSEDEDANVITRRFTLDSIKLDLSLDGYHTRIIEGHTTLSARFDYIYVTYHDEISFDFSCHSTLVANGGGNVTGNNPRRIEKQPNAKWYQPDAEKDPAFSGNLFTYLYSTLIKYLELEGYLE